MGQAKIRGTHEERLALRLGLVERSLDELKRDNNIPANAEFLGYHAYLETLDVFLSEFNDQGGATSNMWGKTPELVKLFMEFSGDYDMSNKGHGSVVVGIFDSEKQVWAAVAQNLDVIK